MAGQRDCLSLDRQIPEEGTQSLSSVIDDVIQNFEPECRLSRLRMAVTHGGETRTTVDRGLIGLVLTGAIIVTLSFLEQTAEPCVDVRSEPLGDGGFALRSFRGRRSFPTTWRTAFRVRRFRRGSRSVRLGGNRLVARNRNVRRRVGARRQPRVGRHDRALDIPSHVAPFSSGFGRPVHPIARWLSRPPGTCRCSRPSIGVRRGSSHDDRSITDCGDRSQGACLAGTQRA